MVYYPIYIKSF